MGGWIYSSSLCRRRAVWQWQIRNDQIFPACLQFFLLLFLLVILSVILLSFLTPDISTPSTHPSSIHPHSFQYTTDIQSHWVAAINNCVSCCCDNVKWRKQHKFIQLGRKQGVVLIQVKSCERHGYQKKVSWLWVIKVWLYPHSRNPAFFALNPTKCFIFDGSTQKVHQTSGTFNREMYYPSVNYGTHMQPSVWWLTYSQCHGCHDKTSNDWHSDTQVLSKQWQRLRDE